MPFARNTGDKAPIRQSFLGKGMPRRIYGYQKREKSESRIMEVLNSARG